MKAQTLKSIANLAIHLSLVPNLEPNLRKDSRSKYPSLREFFNLHFFFLFYFIFHSRARSNSIPNMYKTDDDILARATVETWVIKAEKGEKDCCPKCDGRVFEAEKMVTASVS